MAGGDIKGVMRFPGINKVLDGSFTLSHGPSPSAATLTIIPQEITELVGPLTITDGREEVVFSDCLIDKASMARDSRGRVVSLTIYDRRWRWRWGRISGRYNIRTSASQDDPDEGTVRSPQELAALCLAAVGEADYDIAQLPDTTRPYIDWEYDTNPAEALALLAESLGCRLGLGTDDHAHIWSLGEGDLLPEARALDWSYGVDPADRPDSIVLATAPIRIQADLELEAVGVDVDGAIVPIDELSYTPSVGWDALGDDAAECLIVTDGDYEDSRSITGLSKVRDLARSCVFRWYRVKSPVHLLVPTVDDAAGEHSLDLLLPLLAEQVEYFEDDDGTLQRRPAIVYGAWTNYPDEYPDARMEPDALRQIGTLPTIAKRTLGAFPVAQPLTGDDFRAVVSVPWTLDTARGIVQFSAPVRYYDENDGSNGTLKAATLYLRTSVHVRDPDTRTAYRQEVRHDLVTDPSASRQLTLVQEDIEPWHIAEYQRQGGRLAFVRHRLSAQDVEQSAQHYLDQEAAGALDANALTVRYMGISRVAVDGAIQQVTWTVGGSGATTTASRNDEQPDETLTYAEKRQRDRLAWLLKREADRRKHAVKLSAGAVKLLLGDAT